MDQDGFLFRGEGGALGFDRLGAGANPAKMTGPSGTNGRITETVAGTPGDVDVSDAGEGRLMGLVAPAFFRARGAGRRGAKWAATVRGSVAPGE